MRYVAVSAISHDGLVREHNEDSVVVGPWTLCASVTLTPQTMYFPVGDPLVVAVADGLGGHPAGEEASSLAVREFARVAASLTDETAVSVAINDCNELIYAEAALAPRRTAMGTTLAGLVVTRDAVIVFNVGDSRVYAVDETGLTQVSTDDNEPRLPGGRRSVVVTQCLGGGLREAAIDPHVQSRPLRDGSYLVCTDGLTDALGDDAIAAILADNEGGRAAFELWNATIEAGAPDNVTLALVEISSDPG